MRNKNKKSKKETLILYEWTSDRIVVVVIALQVPTRTYIYAAAAARNGRVRTDRKEKY